MRTVDAYRALLDVEMTLAKTVHPDPRAAFLSLEHRLAGEFRRQFLPRARTAVSAAGVILEAGGERKVSEIRIAAALDAAAFAFVGLGSEVEPVLREIIRAAYLESKRRIRAQAVRKAKAAQLATSMTAVDREAVQALTRHQVYWVGNAYESVSARIAAVSRTMVEQGVSSREAGKMLQQVLSTRLGLSQAQGELFPAPAVTVARGWNGTAIQYFDALAANTVNVARSIGAVRAFRDVGATHLQIRALGDQRTCEVCQWMNGKTFEVEGAAALADQLVAVKTPTEVRVLKPWLHIGAVLRGSGLTREDTGQLPQAKMGRLAAMGMHLTPFHLKCRCVEEVAAVGDFSVLVPELPAPAAAPPAAPPGAAPAPPVPPMPPVPKLPITASEVRDLMAAVRGEDEEVAAALQAIQLPANRAGSAVERVLRQLAQHDSNGFTTVVGWLQAGRLPPRKHPLRRVLARHVELEGKRAALLRRQAQLRAQTIAQVHRLLLEPQRGKHRIAIDAVTWGMEPAALQLARTRFDEALDFVSRLVRRSGFETHEVRVNIFHWGDPRAWADRVSPGVSTVNCHTLSRAKCYVHEIGHTIEFAEPKLRKRLATFLAERTKGERPRRMSVLTGIAGYGPKEVARRDRFAHPYMGRDYGTGDTELLSMGIEYLFTDPVELAIRDPEFFDLLVAMLKGVEL